MFLKSYFGREETKSVTKELVGSILEEEITEIDLEQNPILEKNIKDEKIGILDIRAKLNNDTNCNVEIQLVDQKNIEKRALYYWSKMYIESIKAGHDYSELEKHVKTLMIFILFFKNNCYIISKKQIKINKRKYIARNKSLKKLFKPQTLRKESKWNIKTKN